MRPRSVTELTDVYGMRFLVRVPFDVPIKDGVVQNDFRILRALPTIKYLIGRGARVILLTYVGRDPKNSTEPILHELQKHVPTTYVDAVVGEKVYGAVAHMKEGTALLLENLRSHKGEESNDAEFAKELASYGDFYVNDAFPQSHREYASIVGIPKHLPSFAGITLLEEFDALSRAFIPEHPSLFILGGAKVETKQPLIEAYAHVYTNIFVGGALANDFLKGKGHEVGTSLVSDTNLTESPLLSVENLMLPLDVVAVKEGSERIARIDDVHSDEEILDVGLSSIEMLAPYIKNAKTILWNGPLGYYEGGHDKATKACAKLVAESDAYTIIGGGDTIASVESLGLQDSFSFISTAGGAMLEFLKKKSLPGIEALTHTPKS